MQRKHNPTVKRWGICFIVVLLSCVPIYLQRHSDPALLRDSDTAVLLSVIRREQAPFSWFVRDWPLENHFYRPVSTLVFEMDNALYGNNAAGYGLTNALLCIACVLLLFWFLREFFDRPLPAAAASVLFALWHYQGALALAEYFTYGSWAVLALMLLPGRKWWPPVVLFLCLYYVGWEMAGLRDLSHKVYDWIPGRTASTMTLFALISLAAYARYERVSAGRDLREATALDVPATKSTVPAAAGSRVAGLFAIGSVLACALAMGSYEQAVMLPAALLVVAVAMRRFGFRVRWGWHAAFWSLLVAYLALRSAFIGWGGSQYQDQQIRGTDSALLTLADYALPIAGHIWQFVGGFTDLFLLLSSQAQAVAMLLISHVATVYVAARKWVLVLAGYLLSVLAFLPMAWLNASDFHHYHYWPMAMRAAFLAALGWAALEFLPIAASRPALQAPARPDPAPGSLPRQ
jgi:hypothetical protein